MGIYDRLRRRLDRAGIRPSTRRGQNFLLDTNQICFIADAGGLCPRDVVLEVGPGTGFLTRQLAKSGALVLAVELDRGLLPIAMEATEKFPNVFYLEGDILAGKNRINPEVLARLESMLEMKARQLGGDAARLQCISNLPYSAGTPLVMNLLSSSLPWERGVFLLQREVAERIIASPGGKNYGSLSISSALAAESRIERIVGPGAFWPRPKVDSAVIRMEFKPVAERCGLPWREVRAVCKAVFGSRRKTVKNALKGLFGDGAAAVLSGLGFDADCRGETLSPAAFLDLAKCLVERGCVDGSE